MLFPKGTLGQSDLFTAQFDLCVSCSKTKQLSVEETAITHINFATLYIMAILQEHSIPLQFNQSSFSLKQSAYISIVIMV